MTKTERIVTLLAGLATIGSFLISVPKLTITIPQLEFAGQIGKTVQDFNYTARVFLFFIAEFCNALFFGFLFKIIYDGFKAVAMTLVFISLVALSTVLSQFFITTILFPAGIDSTWKSILFVLFMIISLLITVVVGTAKIEERTDPDSGTPVIFIISYLVFTITVFV